MISKVEIRGFTTQKKCNIEFGPNVTTLTGSSFTGKSTILHAVKFVCMNKPSGDKMISWGANKTSVRLTLDKKKITRRKGKDINSYTLNKQEFNAFGNNVPKPISDLVNMSNINFQGQHEAPFWFCETAGEVSRQLNKIVNLEIIDRTLSNISSRITKANTTIEITQNRLDGAIEDKKELDYIIELDKDLIEIEELEKTKVQIAVESTTLQDITDNVVRRRSRRDNAAQSNLSGLTAIEKGRIWREIRDFIETLDNHVKTGIRADKVLQTVPESIAPLNKLKQQWGEIRSGVENLESSIENIFEAEQVLSETDKEFNFQLKEFHKFEKTMERCPLCKKRFLKK